MIFSVCALLVIGYMVFGMWMSRHTMPARVCQHLTIKILDEQQRQYVSSAEIKNMILGRRLNPMGKPQPRIALQPIEDVVLTHSMVRQAECYKTIDGDVVVAMTQRIPLVRVVTAGETYFVDTDRKFMPIRPSVKTKVLIATGSVSERMATHELSEFALWLRKDPYWRQYIGRVHVMGPRMIHLRQVDGRAEIILGDWSGYEHKLKKLQHWYENGEKIDFQQYQLVDLRFHGQVIGIKQ